MRPYLLQPPIESPRGPRIHRRNDQRNQSHHPRVLLLSFVHQHAGDETEGELTSTHRLEEGERNLVVGSGGDAEVFGAQNRVEDCGQAGGGEEGGDEVAARGFECWGVHVFAVAFVGVIEGI